MVFQDILAGYDSRVDPLRKTLDQDDPVAALSDHWEFILGEINYVPIFHVAREVLLALASAPDVDKAVRDLAGRARDIVRQRAALRHDLMGRVYHRLLAEAKYLGTYYTSVPAATLLLKLALDPARWPVDWSVTDGWTDNLRVADLACGTGTLLMAAVEAISDNYLRECAERQQEPDLKHLHQVLIEQVVYGYDVLPSALHLTASTLAIRTPEVEFSQMQLYSLPLGGPHRRLGSIEFLRDRDVPLTVDLFGPTAGGARVTGAGDAIQQTSSLPKLDLCVMNPPFTRSVGGNRLFGSLPRSEIRPLQLELAKLLRSRSAPANSTAGLGSVFVAVGDRYLKESGRMALVLPKTLLSGVAWGRTRQLFAERYQLEYLIVSHEPGHWNFSENTELSECLIVAKKRTEEEIRRDELADVISVNLWRNPTTVFEALALGHVLAQGSPPSLEEGQGALDLNVGEIKFGEASSVQWRRLREGSWMLPCAFAQIDLARAANDLVLGAVNLPGVGAVGNVPLRRLRELGELGPDRRDIWDGFDQSETHTAYASFWGHDAGNVVTIAQSPNLYLSPLSRARKGRPLRKVTDLWPHAGSTLLAERLWLNTQRLAALRVDTAVLSNVWWPFKFHEKDDDREKALVLWLNSTLGLIILLAHREETRGAWVGFKKPTLSELPVLDTSALSADQIKALADAYDRLAMKDLGPFPEIDSDPLRSEIDGAISAALGLPNIGALRRLLAREPVVCLQQLT